MTMPLEERLGTYIRRADQELMAVKHEAVKPAGLTVAQYAALYALNEAPGMSAAALSRSCFVTPQTMATILKNLQQLGLVERRPHRWHRNVIETDLTPAGRRTLRRADQAAGAIEHHLADNFTDHERETLIELLTRATQALERQRSGHTTDSQQAPPPTAAKPSQ